ncbi:MAG: hypothetical protein ACXWV5_04405 [Flavitalea sp.]
MKNIILTAALILMAACALWAAKRSYVKVREKCNKEWDKGLVKDPLNTLSLSKQILFQ